MEESGTRKKVLCPVENNGKTRWRLLGTAYVNRDNSINVYLDGLPTNGKLHLRDWDETDRREQSASPLRSLAPAAAAATRDDESLPF